MGRKGIVERVFVSDTFNESELTELALDMAQPGLDAEQDGRVEAIDTITGEVLGTTWPRTRTKGKLFTIPGKRYEDIFGPKIAG